MTATQTPDAMALLKVDHAAVSPLFTDYENTRSIAPLEYVEPLGEMYDASLDRVELGARMTERKDELLAQAAGVPG